MRRILVIVIVHVGAHYSAQRDFKTSWDFFTRIGSLRSREKDNMASKCVKEYSMVPGHQNLTREYLHVPWPRNRMPCARWWMPYHDMMPQSILIVIMRLHDANNDDALSCLAALATLITWFSDFFRILLSNLWHRFAYFPTDAPNTKHLS